MKLIVGLGNPGNERELTRHNIGFMTLDHYIGNNSWSDNKYASEIKLKINKENVIFIKPKTYMNLSGTAVEYYMHYYKIGINDILIIQDDLDLSCGKIKIKKDSSSGGHNGIKDIICKLKTTKFCRIKIGISKPNDKSVVDYVLGKFSKEEQIIINNVFVITDKIINDFIANEPVEQLMNKYNNHENTL